MLKRSYKNKDILCCLSGGGFRMMECAAGVLQAIDSHNIKISNYYAASAGGIVGGMHASGMTGNKIEELIRRTPVSSLMTTDYTVYIPFYTAKSVYTREPMKKMIAANVDNDIISKTVKVSATVEDTQATVMLPGSVDALMATSAIPEVFPPVTINGVTYVDGGVKNNIPIPKIVDIPKYEMIIIIMCNDDVTNPPNFWSRMFNWKSVRAIDWLNATMAREFNQVWESWTDLSNVVIIQPPPFRSELMTWSDKFGLIEHARNHALSVL